MRHLKAARFLIYFGDYVHGSGNIDTYLVTTITRSADEHIISTSGLFSGFFFLNRNFQSGMIWRMYKGRVWRVCLPRFGSSRTFDSESFITVRYFVYTKAVLSILDSVSQLDIGHVSTMVLIVRLRDDIVNLTMTHTMQCHTAGT